jgi:hypothetical protein
MRRSSVEKAEAARDLWVHKPITRGMTPYAWIPSFVSGEWLAHLSTESERSEVYVRPLSLAAEAYVASDRERLLSFRSDDPGLSDSLFHKLDAHVGQSA